MSNVEPSSASNAAHGGGAASSEKLKFTGIQILRAVAASLVIWSHLGPELSRLPYSHFNDSRHLAVVGVSGVDLFFVISGFIMVYITKREATAGIFLKKRIMRIVPAYWIYTALAFAVALVTPTLKQHAEHSFAYIAASFFFVPWPRPGDGTLEPFYQLGWTLNYEMFFYAVFALLLLCFRQRGRVIVLLFLAGAAACGSFVPSSLPQLWFWTRPIILEFALGGLVAWMFLNNVRLQRRRALALILVGSCIAAGSLCFAEIAPSLRVLVWGLPFAAVVAGTALAKWNDHREPARMRRSLFGLFKNVLVKIGDSSYSLYLSHMFVIRLITMLMPQQGLGGLYWIVYLIFVFPIAYVVAWISYRWIEMPAMVIFKSN